jgi:hypothetical protein
MKATSLGLVKKILGNKKLQRAALNTGYNLGLGAAKKIQQRRQRRGKIQLFRNVQMVQPRAIRNKAVSNTMAVPARVMVSTQGSATTSTANENGSGLLCTAWGNYLVDNNLHKTIVNPADPDFIGRLAKVASLYQKFTITRLQFVYQPTVGTNMDGAFQWAFSPDADLDVTDTDTLASLGGYNTVSVAQPLTYQVPVSALNKAFRVQYTGLPEVTTTTDPIHNIGALFWAVTNMPASATNNTPVGAIKCNYTIRFSDPKLSYTDQLTEVASHSAGENGVIQLDVYTSLNGVSMYIRTATADVFRRRGRQDSALLVLYGVTGATLTMQVGNTEDDLAPQAPIFSSNSGTTTIALFQIGQGERYVSLSSDTLSTAASVYRSFVTNW